MKKFLQWLFGIEIRDFIWDMFVPDFYSRIDRVESTYRTAKEYVMQKKLSELGYEIKNVFPKPMLYKTGDDIEIEPFPKHPTGFFEVVRKCKSHHHPIECPMERDLEKAELRPCPFCGQLPKKSIDSYCQGCYGNYKGPLR